MIISVFIAQTTMGVTESGLSGQDQAQPERPATLSLRQDNTFSPRGQTLTNGAQLMSEPVLTVLPYAASPLKLGTGNLFLATTIGSADPCGRAGISPLHLSRSDRIRVQQNLQNMGYNTGGLDGVLGRRSRASIRHWQTQIACRPTGFLNQEQFDMLENQGKGPKSAPDQSEARNKAEAQERELKLSQLDRLRVERSLAAAGFEPGPAEGTFDLQTRRAITDYQTHRGLTQTGYLDQITYVRMLSEGILQ